MFYNSYEYVCMVADKDFCKCSIVTDDSLLLIEQFLG